MLDIVVRSLCRNSRGLVLVGGAIAVMTGVKHLMKGAAANGPAPVAAPSKTVKSDRFSIRRTQSDLGYTYWVVQGHGKYSGFSLFDTWEEAVDEVARQTRQAMKTGWRAAADLVAV